MRSSPVDALRNGILAAIGDGSASATSGDESASKKITAALKEFKKKFKLSEGFFTTQLFDEDQRTRDTAFYQQRLHILTLIDFKALNIKATKLKEILKALLTAEQQDALLKFLAQQTAKKTKRSDLDLVLAFRKFSELHQQFDATIDEAKKSVCVTAEKFLDQLRLGRDNVSGVTVLGDIDFSRSSAGAKNIFKSRANNVTFENDVTFHINTQQKKKEKPNGRLNGVGVRYSSTVTYQFNDGQLSAGKPVKIYFSGKPTAEDEEKYFIIDGNNAAEILGEFSSYYKAELKKDLFSIFRGTVYSRLKDFDNSLEKINFLFQRAYSQPWLRTSRALQETILKVHSEEPIMMLLPDSPPLSARGPREEMVDLNKVEEERKAAEAAAKRKQKTEAAAALEKKNQLVFEKRIGPVFFQGWAVFKNLRKSNRVLFSEKEKSLREIARLIEQEKVAKAVEVAEQYNNKYQDVKIEREESVCALEDGGVTRVKFRKLEEAHACIIATLFSDLIDKLVERANTKSLHAVSGYCKAMSGDLDKIAKCIGQKAAVFNRFERETVLLANSGEFTEFVKTLADAPDDSKLEIKEIARALGGLAIPLEKQQFVLYILATEKEKLLSREDNLLSQFPILKSFINVMPAKDELGKKSPPIKLNTLKSITKELLCVSSAYEAISNIELPALPSFVSDVSEHTVKDNSKKEAMLEITAAYNAVAQLQQYDLLNLFSRFDSITDLFSPGSKLRRVDKGGAVELTAADLIEQEMKLSYLRVLSKFTYILFQLNETMKNVKAEIMMLNEIETALANNTSWFLWSSAGNKENQTAILKLIEFSDALQTSINQFQAAMENWKKRVDEKVALDGIQDSDKLAFQRELIGSLTPQSDGAVVAVAATPTTSAHATTLNAVYDLTMHIVTSPKTVAGWAASLFATSFACISKGTSFGSPAKNSVAANTDGNVALVTAKTTR